MRVLIAGDDEITTAKIRHAILRGGFDSAWADVVSVGDATETAGQARFNLIVLVLPPENDSGAGTIHELRSVSDAMLLVVGPTSDSKLLLQLLRAGADEYLGVTELDTELNATLVRLKAKQRPKKNEGRVIGILAPCGGSGASTLAANLAVGLAKRHDQAALVDMRLTAGDQTFLLDLKPAHSLADLCRKRERMDEEMFRQSLIRHDSGVHLLAAPENSADADGVAPEGIRQILAFSRSLFPYVVIDLDRSLGAEQIAAIVQTDLLLMAIRLDMTSLRNAGRILDRLEKLGIAGERVRVVVNRYRQPKELAPHRAEQALSTRIFHYVPDDPGSVNLSNNKGIPVVLERPRAKVSKSILELAGRITALTAPLPLNGRAQRSDPTLMGRLTAAVW